MKINNEFTVSAPIDEAWNALLDLERIAPCLPGAAIQESTGDGEYKGTMKVKIGPITATYKGTVKFEETDEKAHRAVIKASGREARGQGTASATITSALQEDGDRTKVSVETDMKLTGRAAQFGRGIAQDVAEKMLGQFADCLERELSGTPAEAAVGETEAGESGKKAEGGAKAPAPGTPAAAPAGGTGSLGTVISSEPGTAAAGGTVAGTVVSGAAAEGAGGAGEEQHARQEPRPEPEPFDLGAASQEAIFKRLAPVLAGIAVVAFLIWLIRR